MDIFELFCPFPVLRALRIFFFLYGKYGGGQALHLHRVVLQLF